MLYESLFMHSQS